MLRGPRSAPLSGHKGTGGPHRASVQTLSQSSGSQMFAYIRITKKVCSSTECWAQRLKLQTQGVWCRLRIGSFLAHRDAPGPC